MYIHCLYIAFLAVLAVSQSLPPKPKGLQTLNSKLVPGASISFKKTTICETTPGVKAFSGYVHLPNQVLGDIEAAIPYNISLFFWFFEARNASSRTPTAIYLSGGPGDASMNAVIEENGPCMINKDSKSTRANPWSWNNHVNMLYIDQPVQVGFSYDKLINGTLNLITKDFTEVTNGNFGKTDATILAGTFPSQKPMFTANTTAISARTLWHFSQVWFSEFSNYNTDEKRIGIWGTSYGGFYGPATFAYFLRQNEKIKKGFLSRNSTIYLHMDTLGIQNGCIDLFQFIPSYPQMAYNNSYGLQIINKTVYDNVMRAYTMENGCRDLSLKCQTLGQIGDPEELGTNQTVNDACTSATEYCWGNIVDLFDSSGLSVFDISQKNPDPILTSYSATYYNQDWVQADLGVPLNFTFNVDRLPSIFFQNTGDPARRTGNDFSYIIESGYNVAMVYGDLDYRCNWIGAENTILNSNFTNSGKFKAAGYENIKANETYVGGVVRQHNGISFSRVFEAGHIAVRYQPETVYHIFTRSMLHSDVATGIKNTGTGSPDYSSSGPSSSFGIERPPLPPSKPPVCSLWDLTHTCTQNQIEAFHNKTAIVENFIMISPTS